MESRRVFFVPHLLFVVFLTELEVGRSKTRGRTTGRRSAFQARRRCVARQLRIFRPWDGLLEKKIHGKLGFGNPRKVPISQTASLLQWCFLSSIVALNSLKGTKMIYK